MGSLSSIPAAQYVRMSTDQQQYSILSQTTANQRYADVHGFTIVRSYEDPGRSGLSIKGRTGLAPLAFRSVRSRRCYDTAQQAVIR
jgi:Resolvase, N terminal domain